MSRKIFVVLRFITVEQFHDFVPEQQGSIVTFFSQHPPERDMEHLPRVILVKQVEELLVRQIGGCRNSRQFSRDMVTPPLMFIETA